MRRHQSEFVRAVVERGFVHQATDLEGLDRLAARERITAYIGFDCTADSLHVGHLVSIMLLRWLQRTGHRPIALIGGGTSKVGDPSGKDESRQLLDDATISRNIEGIRRSLEGDPSEPLLRFGGAEDDALLVNNADWLDRLQYIPFLREVGRCFTINRMLTFDSVRLRLDREQPLTFLEFNYMVMQAYDFLELSRGYDCRLQAGGSDQWGNIVNGVELARRIDGRTVFGLVTPLITTASGAKMGKTAQGAIWLNEDRLGFSQYYQYWRNVDDADVGRFLRLFTELPLAEIEQLEKRQGAELNEAKEKLAFEATKLCRGEEKAEAAKQAAQAIFRPHTDELPLGDSVSVEVTRALPTIEVPRHEFDKGLSVVELLQRSGLVSSKGEARRLIRGRGARVNDKRVEDETQVVTTDHLDHGQLMLWAGKKRHALVRVV